MWLYGIGNLQCNDPQKSNHIQHDLQYQEGEIDGLLKNYIFQQKNVAS